jgi:plastocyanin
MFLPCQRCQRDLAALAEAPRPLDRAQPTLNNRFRKSSSMILWVFVAALFAVATGCNQGLPPAILLANHNTASQARYTQIDPATAGTIIGTIHFAGATPRRIAIDMTPYPACAYASKTPNLSEQYVVHNGRLANVFVYVQAGLGAKRYAPPTTPVVIDQRGCRYIPHVIGVMAGQPVEFRNSDPTLHNIHAASITPGNPEFDISQPPRGGAQQHIFAMPELMIPLRCDLHPWMEAYVNVASSPFYAISDADGHFEIKGLPPGTYTIAAVHEKLASKVMQVTVPAKSTVQANFIFRK